MTAECGGFMTAGCGGFYDSSVVALRSVVFSDVAVQDKGLGRNDRLWSGLVIVRCPPPPRSQKNKMVETWKLVCEGVKNWVLRDVRGGGQLMWVNVVKGE